MSQVLKFRDNPGQLSIRDTIGTIAIFPGPSRPNRDGWQLCPVTTITTAQSGLLLLLIGVMSCDWNNLIG